MLVFFQFLLGYAIHFASEVGSEVCVDAVPMSLYRLTFEGQLMRNALNCTFRGTSDTKLAASDEEVS